MDPPKPDRQRCISIAECEICSQLSELETSFYKYGKDELTRPLPREAARLVDVDEVQSSPRPRGDIKRCPICGTFYYFVVIYEFLVNGSEDEEELTRLTPAQARRFLSDDEYDRLIELHTGQMQAANPLSRRYAAKCLVSHHLDRQEPAAVEPYLLHSDAEVAKGALWFLHTLLDDEAQRQQLASLTTPLESLSQSADKDTAAVAKSILARLKKTKAVKRDRGTS